MANDCYFEMKIKGTRRDCEAWVKRMMYSSEPNHFYRVYSADVYDYIVNGDENWQMFICGECAWSLFACSHNNIAEDEDLFAVNTKELNLVMEAYSSEPGVGFQEHYIYDHGECKVSEEVDYAEYYYAEDEFDSFDDFKAEFSLPESLTEDDLDDGVYRVGGYKRWVYSF